MTTENIITIALSLFGVLFSFLGAVRTQKAYKIKERKRVARMKRNKEQIMATLMENEASSVTAEQIVSALIENELPSIATEDDTAAFSDVEKMLLANVERHHSDKYAKFRKNGKVQYQILIDDFSTQKQEHIS